MLWLEANPLPDMCLDCQEEDCYGCEISGKRWSLSRQEELEIRKKGLLRAIERLQRQIKAIDLELQAAAEQ